MLFNFKNLIQQQQKPILDSNVSINTNKLSSFHQPQQSPKKQQQNNNQETSLNPLYDLINNMIKPGTNKNGLTNQLSQQSLVTSKPNSLYVNKSCSWPDCPLVSHKFDSFDAYTKLHLNIEHRLDEKSHKELLKQIYLMESIEAELNKQKQILNDMLLHLNNQLESFKQQQQFQQQSAQNLHINDLIAFTQLKNPNPTQNLQKQIINPQSKTITTGLVTPVGVDTFKSASSSDLADREKFNKYSNLKRPYEFKTVSHLGEGKETKLKTRRKKKTYY